MREALGEQGELADPFLVVHPGAEVVQAEQLKIAKGQKAVEVVHPAAWVVLCLLVLGVLSPFPP